MKKVLFLWLLCLLVLVFVFSCNRNVPEAPTGGVETSTTYIGNESKGDKPDGTGSSNGDVVHDSEPENEYAYDYYIYETYEDLIWAFSKENKNSPIQLEKANYPNSRFEAFVDTVVENRSLMLPMFDKLTISRIFVDVREGAFDMPPTIWIYGYIGDNMVQVKLMYPIGVHIDEEMDINQIFKQYFPKADTSIWLEKDIKIKNGAVSALVREEGNFWQSDFFYEDMLVTVRTKFSYLDFEFMSSFELIDVDRFSETSSGNTTDSTNNSIGTTLGPTETTLGPTDVTTSLDPTTVIGDKSYVSYENGSYFINLPLSKKKVRVPNEEAHYLKYIDDEMLNAADESFQIELSRYKNVISSSVDWFVSLEQVNLNLSIYYEYEGPGQFAGMSASTSMGMAISDIIQDETTTSRENQTPESYDVPSTQDTEITVNSGECDCSQCEHCWNKYNTPISDVESSAIDNNTYDSAMDVSPTDTTLPYSDTEPSYPTVDSMQSSSEEYDDQLVACE